jgi:hypothetical protein
MSGEGPPAARVGVCGCRLSLRHFVRKLGGAVIAVLAVLTIVFLVMKLTDETTQPAPLPPVSPPPKYPPPRAPPL